MAGATIMQPSITGGPVQTDCTYTFAQGQFTGGPGGSPGAHTVSNQQGGMFNFGLLQRAMVNNVPVWPPLNAIPVLNNGCAAFTPEETVYVFLSSVTNNGVVLSQVASNALVVPLTSQNPSANIGYNDSSNSFYLAADGLMSSHAFARRLRSNVARTSQG